MLISEKLRMTSGLLLFASALLMNGNVWAAEACTATPTCAALGYTQTTCNGFASLKCPFDTTKLFCSSDTCASGYVYGEMTGKCGTTSPDVIKVNGTVVGIAVRPHLVVALADQAKMTWDSAKLKCAQTTFSGDKRWRLPTIDELTDIYNKLSYFNKSVFLALGFKPMVSTTYTEYWSNNEASYNGDPDYAKLLVMPHGSIGSQGKDVLRPSRCVANF